jgi:hypothetical protein
MSDLEDDSHEPDEKESVIEGPAAAKARLVGTVETAGEETSTPEAKTAEKAIDRDTYDRNPAFQIPGVDFDTLLEYRQLVQKDAIQAGSDSSTGLETPLETELMDQAYAYINAMKKQGGWGIGVSQIAAERERQALETTKAAVAEKVLKALEDSNGSHEI